MQETMTVGSVQVAAVKGEPTVSGSNQRQMMGGVWKPKQSYREMLDSPCNHHNDLKPATHTNQNYSWTRRMAQGDNLALAPARADDDG